MNILKKDLGSLIATFWDVNNKLYLTIILIDTFWKQKETVKSLFFHVCLSLCYSLIQPFFFLALFLLSKCIMTAV